MKLESFYQVILGSAFYRGGCSGALGGLCRPPENAPSPPVRTAWESRAELRQRNRGPRGTSKKVSLLSVNLPCTCKIRFLPAGPHPTMENCL